MSSHSLPVLPPEPPVSPVSPESPETSPAAGDEFRGLAESIDGEVRLGLHDRQLYATDASIYQVTPLAVVIPRHLDDLREAVRFCSENALPILPRGGGTSLAGQAVNRAVVIDCSPHCTRVLDIDPENHLACVEPGVVLDQLNAAASEYGLMFGPDVATATHATLGGMIGNNSSGAHSILYGRTVEHLHSIKTLLADGRELDFYEGAAAENRRVAEFTRRIAEVVLHLGAAIRDRYPRTLRRVNGYNLDLILDQLEQSSPDTFDRVNLAHLFCGSEGSLGLTLEATLRLVESPKKKALAIIAFSSVDEALASLVDILSSKPAAVELLDDLVMRAAEGNPQCRPLLDLLPSPHGEYPPAVLYVEFFAEDESYLTRKRGELIEIYGEKRVIWFTDPVSRSRAWTLRKSGEPLLYGLPGRKKPVTFVEDLAVPPENLGEFVTEFRELLNRHGLSAAWYAHASVGCLHIRPLVNLHDASDRTLMETIIGEATDLVRRYGGALSGEHGDGRLRSHLLERYYGPEICAGFRKIKEIFDPQHLMNPGVIVDPPPMLESLRVIPEKEEVVIPAVDTYFRYEREDGFSRAIEQCNGAGVCRKMQGGTMCPSYRATRDERHATRGRGNALRLAITHQSLAGLPNFGQGSPIWNDPETLKTLDLCLSCKACKTECPSNVDIAKLKAEYLAQSFRLKGRIPLAARFFGHVQRLNKWGSHAPGLLNAAGKMSFFRGMMERMTGIDRRRSLPDFHRSLHHWFTRRNSPDPQERSAIILFPDCFTVYNEPHIGKAAVRILESCGYRVLLPDIGCCGRSLISTGLLAKAQKVCAETVRYLAEIVKRENPVAIVGCEPGCISAITDDWLDLKMNVDPSLVETIASKTFLLDHFLESHWDHHPQHPPFSPLDSNKTILFHAHCHQKALWGAESSSRLLERILLRTGGQITTIDAGCCGMAGAFGMTTDHYDLSMKIGELALFPAIREQPEAIIAATGTSCRHQILDGTGVRVLHPLELISSMLPPDIYLD